MNQLLKPLELMWMLYELKNYHVMIAAEALAEYRARVDVDFRLGKLADEEHKKKVHAIEAMLHVFR